MNLRRRDFIILLGGAAPAWPIAADAQQAKTPLIGYLEFGSPEARAYMVSAFRKGLGELGYVEGRNVTIEYRWGNNDIGSLQGLAADLVSRRVTVIAVTGGGLTALAAKAATSSIPIVFGTAADPIQSGLVASLNRPGGNVTGVTNMSIEVSAKRLGLLHELLPRATRFGLLRNPDTRSASTAELREAASTIGAQIEEFSAGSSDEIDHAFANLVQNRDDAVLLVPHPLFSNRRVQLVTLASRHGIPAIYYDREYANAGGLMSYGASAADQARQVGIYVGRVLNGEKPADLPVIQATKFELVINLTTARALGLAVPPTLLAIADEVIE
jgi:putative tryptophan/tyrosine transport system substrate-binding protein